MNSDRGHDVAHVVLESAIDDIVSPRSPFGISIPGVFINPVQTKDPHPLIQFLGFRGDLPSFPSGKVLGRIKTECDGVAPTRSYGHSPVPRAHRVSRVFDNE